MKNIAGFISILSILFFFTSGLYSEGQKEPAIISNNGIISYLEGDVSINNNSAEIGHMVKSTDTIKTGENSYCEVVFGQSNVFKLDENTITQINWTQSDIKIQAGAISAVFTKLNKFLNDEKDFTISTPTIVAGVRGTVFYLKVEDQKNTYLCICNGKLNIGNAEDEMDISSGHHQAFRFTLNNKIVTTSSAEMLYHTDDTMNNVAESVNYIIPWDNDAYSGMYKY